MRSIHRPRQGFTLFELLVVIALISIMATIATPNFLRLIQRSKLTGMAQQTTVLVRLARQHSIRYNVPTVVLLDLTNEQVVAFVDVDGAGLGSPPDRVFNPVAGQPHRSTDFELARYTLPPRVEWRAPTAQLIVNGFTNDGTQQVAIFDPNGSARDAGAFRIADAYDNFLEIRVAPATTGRVRLRNWHEADGKWYIRNETDKPWEWK